MRAVGWWLLLVCVPAAADEGTPGVAVRVSRRWEQPSGPLLHLDDLPRLGAEGVGADVAREGDVLALGPRARLALEGEWWESQLTPRALGLLGADPLDDRARGWRGAAELSYDLGPFRVGASVAMGHVDDRYGSGTYQMVGLFAYKTFRLSRWMRAWIALGITHQQWNGTPPPGESNATTIGLSLGTTFR